MAHRINFDEMVERRLADVQAAYGDEVGDWHLYFDLDELDGDDKNERDALESEIYDWLADGETVTEDADALAVEWEIYEADAAEAQQEAA